MVKVPAYILAGGRSRRMRRDKATLRPVAGGPTLAQRVADVLAQAGAEPVFVVGRQPELQSLGIPVVPDPEVQHFHPLYGVAAALEHALHQGWASALILPCDLPSLTVDAITPLLAAASPTVGVAGDHIQPLIAKLPSAWARRARQAADANMSARQFVLQASIAQVRIATALAHDVDTPDDLAEWSRRYAAND